MNLSTEQKSKPQIILFFGRNESSSSNEFNKPITPDNGSYFLSSIRPQRIIMLPFNLKNKEIFEAMTKNSTGLEILKLSPCQKDLIKSFVESKSDTIIVENNVNICADDENQKQNSNVKFTRKNDYFQNKWISKKNHPSNKFTHKNNSLRDKWQRKNGYHHNR